ncbi:MAG: LacI family DNA-binding transcriptional regulator [Nibricoccus sp.]
MSISQPKKTTPQIRSSTEFARYVGLARTTVSRVLNGQPGLKPKTIERVRRAIEETGFVPNAYALHLKGKRTATIGICVENLLTPPVVRKLAALQHQLREKNYTSLIEVIEAGHGDKVIRHFLSMRVEAVVFIGHFNEDELTRHIAELVQRETPHLIIDHFGIKGANTVTLDRPRAMQMVMDHLFDLGHRRFGLLAFNSQARSVRDRLRATQEALLARGLVLEQAIEMFDGAFPRTNDFEEGRRIARTAVERGNLPTAFIAVNDEVAIGAMRGLQETGVRVPEDVSIAGFNNLDVCLMPTPALTSVDQRIEETVQLAVEALLPQLGQPPAAKASVKMIEPLLVVRGSTAPAKT